MAPLRPAHGLEALRREIDRIDDAVVELLAERMRVVGAIAEAKRRDGASGPAIRPGREAVILRRLVARAGGRLPVATLVRMWRELLAAATRAQAPLSVAVWAPPDRPALWDLARDHFGSGTPARRVGDAAAALRLAAEDPTCLAVLPFPDGEEQAWWASLLEPGHRDLRVVARLPFAAGDGGAAVPGGAAVGLLEPEPSGDDACLLAVEAIPSLEPERLLALVAGAAACPSARHLAAARRGGGGASVHLLELPGRPRPEEAALAAVLGSKGGHVLRAAWLGGYARPLAGRA